MTKKKGIYYSAGAIILLLIAANIALLRRSAACKNELKIKEQIIANIGINTHFTSFLEGNWLWNLTGERLDLSDWQLTDSSGREVSWKNIIKKPVLAYRFHHTDCQECISFGLRKLESFIKDHPAVKPLLIAQYPDHYPFKRWCRINGMSGMKAVNARETLPPDEMEMPYFFMIHPDLTLGELFIPDKSSPQYTSRYLKIINEKYVKR